MEKFLTFDDVRQYLVEGDAASEAEQILLKSLKQDELRNQRYQAEQKLTTLQREEKKKEEQSFRPNVLKISDLLDSFDEPMIQRVSRPKATTDTAPPTSTTPATNTDTPTTITFNSSNDIDRALQDELFRLEEMKLAIQRKAQDDKLRLERRQKLAELQYQQDHPEAIKTTSTIEQDLQKKLLSLAEERVLRSAAQRAEIEQKTRELQALTDGSIPYRQLPSVRSYLPSKKDDASSSSSPRQSSSDTASAASAAATDARQKRVQHILSDINQPDRLDERRRKIQQLKQESQKAPVDALEELLVESKSTDLVSASAPVTARRQSRDAGGSGSGHQSSSLRVPSRETAAAESPVRSIGNNSRRDRSSVSLEQLPQPQQPLTASPAAPAANAPTGSLSFLQQQPQQQTQGLMTQPPAYVPSMMQQQPQQLPPSFLSAAPQPFVTPQPSAMAWQQQLLQQQMQQLEAENMRLQQQMMFGGAGGGAGGGGGPMMPPGLGLGMGMPPGLGGNGFMMMPQPRDYLMGGGFDGGGPVSMQGPQPLNGLDPAFLSAAGPGMMMMPGGGGLPPSNVPPLTREERIRREEIRRIEFEMEKLKKSSELQEFRQQLEQRQRQQREEEEHARWLDTQKRELQRLKMEQVLQKEKRLLELAQQPLSAAGGVGGFGGGPAGGGLGNDENYRLEGLRDACGVGGGIANSGALALPMVNGLAVIVDGFMFTVAPNRVHPYANMLCRVALGVYDRQGRAVVRLVASDWTSFVVPPDASAEMLVSAKVVQALQPSLLRNVAVEWDTGGGGGGGGESGISHAVALEYHRNRGLRAVVELQVKDAQVAGGEARPLGWCVLPLTRLLRSEVAMTGGAAGGGAAGGALAAVLQGGDNSGGGNATTVVLNRDCYCLGLRQGLSDPTVALDDLSGAVLGDSSGSVGGGGDVAVLLRVVEKKDFGRATAWQLAQQTQLSSADVAALYQSQPRLLSGGTTGGNGGGGGSAVASSARLQPPGTPAGLTNNALSLTSLSSSRSSLLSGQSGRMGAPSMASPMSSRPVTSGLSVRDLLNPSNSGGGGSINPSMASPGNVADSRSRLAAVPEEDTASSAAAATAAAVPATPAPVVPRVPLLSTAVTNAAKERERDRFWLLGAPLSPATDRYQRGDGLDIYIDAARFLPDNVTITRVSLRIFSSSKEQMGPTYEAVCDPASPAMFPRYLLKAELRATGGSGSINATATGLLRIDTLDSCNLSPVAVGYACFKLFCTAPDRLQQPKAASEPGIFVNKGAFQLRLRAGRISPSLDRFSEAMLSELTVIPCASVLVRILPAPKSADGISTLSRDEIPREKWQSLGLMLSAPRYDVGSYTGIYAEPTAQEWLAYEAKAKCIVKATAATTAAGAPSAVSGVTPTNGGGGGGGGSGWDDARSAEAEVACGMTVLPNHSLPPPPSRSSADAAAATNVTVAAGDTTIIRRGGDIVSTAATESTHPGLATWLRWWKGLIPAPEQVQRVLDYSLVLPYSVEAGFNVDIMGMNRIPADRIFPQLTQPPKGLLSGLFTPTITPGSNTSLFVPKLLTSLSPPALLYAEPPLFDGVQVSRQWDVLRPMNVPRCLDGFQAFSPAEMSSRLFVVVDVRFVEVTLPPPVTGKGSNNKSKATASDATGTEVCKAAGRTRQYWTMFPLARERSPGLGHGYVLSGYVASPLFEGPVPTDGLLTSPNPYKELVTRLQQGIAEQKQGDKNGGGGKGGSTTAAATASGSSSSSSSVKKGGGESRAIRLSEGASILARVVNPLLRDLVAPSLGNGAVAGAGSNMGSGGSGSDGTASAAPGTTPSSPPELPPDATYLRSLLSAAWASPAQVDAFAYVPDREVHVAMELWRNNSRDNSLPAKDAAARVAMTQVIPKLPGAGNGSTNVQVIAQAVLQTSHDFFVQDIGLLKK